MNIVRVFNYQYSLYFKAYGPATDFFFLKASPWIHTPDIQECG